MIKCLKLFEESAFLTCVGRQFDAGGPSGKQKAVRDYTRQHITAAGLVAARRLEQH